MVPSVRKSSSTIDDVEGHVLHLAARVGEAQVDVFDVLFLDLLEDVGNTRCEPELVGQQRARLPVNLQALGLAAAAVERKHQLGSEPLPVWVVDAQSLELAHDREVAAEREVCIDSLLYGRKPELIQALRLDPRGPLRLEVGQRSAAPEGLGCPERRGCGNRSAAGECLSALDRQSLELLQVELPRLYSQQVPGRMCDETWWIDAGRGQHLAQSGDLVAQCVIGRVRAQLGEQFRDEAVTRDDAIRAEQ